MPGVSIKIDVLTPKIDRAVELGFVKREHANFVLNGLRFGFDLGIDTSKLKGRIGYRNYPSALNARAQISKSVRSRIGAQKTLCLGKFDSVLKSEMSAVWDTWRIFPLGGVPKPLEPDSIRLISDHTRSGLKWATDMDFFAHTLNAYSEIAAFLKPGYFMRVGDIDGAFPLLPLSPALWQYFLFRWWDVEAEDDDECADECLYVHVCGDFGAAGLPGTWKIFFTDVVVGVARSENILSHPLVVYVDDTGSIGSDRVEIDREGVRFQEFLSELGVFMKDLKIRAAAVLQLMLGFWWDSLTQTRTLEEKKFISYVDMLTEFADRRTLTLREMQQAAGRMQRAILTLPPGAACFLANLFALMRGLSLPWQKRRVTRVTRRDFAALRDLLQLNMGKGFYAFDQFKRAPAVFTDASRSRAYTGGGYVSMCGRYRYWSYGKAAAKHLIDVLEGDAFLLAVEDLCDTWKRCVVPCHIDNRTFGSSVTKGWSRATRLGQLLKRLFSLAVQHECIFEVHWIASKDNMYADALSRAENEALFLKLALKHELFQDPYITRRHPLSGHTRKFGPEYSSDITGDGPTRQQRLPSSLSVQYERASIYQGLPSQEVLDAVDAIIDARLSTSSLQSVSSALAQWDILRARHGWDRIILTGDSSRGGKLATWVAYMVNETELVSASIANYVWAVRTWMKYQRQDDPIFGVPEWDDYMQGVHVVAWVQSEPRRRVPLNLIFEALRMVNPNVFWEVQAAVLMLILLFTFARSETPCPKSFAGEGALDPDKHLLVRDIRVRAFQGRSYVQMRLKSIKQDGRMERPEAAGNEDWINIGDVPDSDFSILKWLRLLFSFHGGARAHTDPFFLDHDRSRWLTYSNALRDVRALWARASSVEEANRYGLHSLRVAGYNGAKQGKHGTVLACAHGGWSSDAHERYARFLLDDVLDLAGIIIQQNASDGLTANAPELQRAPLPLSGPVLQPGPRPERPSRSGTGPIRGSRRRRSETQAPVTNVVRARDLLPDDRISIYWTEERRWYRATIKGWVEGTTFSVIYDAHDAFQSLRERTFSHDLNSERWRALSS